MPSATRVQIFDAAAPCLTFVKNKKPFQIIDLERLRVEGVPSVICLHSQAVPAAREGGDKGCVAEGVTCLLCVRF